MKLAGMFMLVCGSSGMGLWMYGCLKRRIRCMEQIIWLFHYMESEVNYRKSEVSYIFEYAAKRMEEPFRTMLLHTAMCMREKSSSFREIWDEEMIWLLAHSDLKKEDISIVEELASDGYQDKQMQMIQIRLIREKMEQRQKKLVEELAQKGKLYICIGILSGMVVSIVLI